MAQKNKGASDADKRVIVQNRRARHEYFIEDTWEAGIVLMGSEVKSLRDNKANIADSYAGPSGEELFLFNAHISEYKQANRMNHHPTRPRKLLLHKREINKLMGQVRTKGKTLVALSLYFDKNNRVKVELALASGKKQHDKRETEKKRDWNREKARMMREK